MADVSVEEFSAEVSAFLDANAKRKVEEHKPFVWGEGDDDISLFEETDRETEQRELAEAKAWRAKRYDAGLGWITGPKEFGGRELSQAHERAYGHSYQRRSNFQAAMRKPWRQGTGLWGACTGTTP